MRKLIIVSGASGAGKSFFLETARQIDGIIPIAKLSTREPRSYEGLDSKRFIDVFGGRSYEEVRQCDYVYLYADNYYGFNRREINDIFAQSKNPIVIVNNYETLVHLLTEYHDVLSIYIMSTLSGKDLAGILKKQGRTEIEIEKRMETAQQDIKNFAEHISENLFTYVLINAYDTSLEIQMRDIFSRHLY